MYTPLINLILLCFSHNHAVIDGELTTTAMTFQTDRTSPLTSTEATTEQPSQTDTTQGSIVASTGAGAIAGIVIVVLLLLAAAVVSVLIVVIFVWRRKHYKSVNPNTDPNKSELIVRSFRSRSPFLKIIIPFVCMI